MTYLDRKWIMKHAANWHTFDDPVTRLKLQRAFSTLKEIIEERAAAGNSSATLVLAKWERQELDRLDDERRQKKRRLDDERHQRKRKVIPERERDPRKEHMRLLRSLQSIQDPVERHRVTVAAERIFESRNR
jgi:transposase